MSTPGNRLAAKALLSIWHWVTIDSGVHLVPASHALWSCLYKYIRCGPEITYTSFLAAQILAVTTASATPVLFTRGQHSKSVSLAVNRIDIPSSDVVDVARTSFTEPKNDVIDSNSPVIPSPLHSRTLHYDLEARLVNLIARATSVEDDYVAKVIGLASTAMTGKVESAVAKEIKEDLSTKVKELLETNPAVLKAIQMMHFPNPHTNGEVSENVTDHVNNVALAMYSLLKSKLSSTQSTATIHDIYKQFEEPFTRWVWTGQ
ncbi:hypothetical protein H0H93_008913 [Arthromyces matolae]|nr:hypothetical protein H0H93_008913 [Arthromyces matolae]